MLTMNYEFLELNMKSVLNEMKVRREPALIKLNEGEFLKLELVHEQLGKDKADELTIRSVDTDQTQIR